MCYAGCSSIGRADDTNSFMFVKLTAIKQYREHHVKSSILFTPPPLCSSMVELKKDADMLVSKTAITSKIKL